MKRTEFSDNFYRIYLLSSDKDKKVFSCRRYYIINVKCPFQTTVDIQIQIVCVIHFYRICSSTTDFGVTVPTFHRRPAYVPTSNDSYFFLFSLKVCILRVPSDHISFVCTVSIIHTVIHRLSP